MKNNSFRIISVYVPLIFVLILLSGGCKKTPNPIKFQSGTFPDTVINLEGLNSAYDDYNSTLPVLGNEIPIIFSSNRGSSGGQFDLVTGTLTYSFNQTNGRFTCTGSMSSDPFYSAITGHANTTGNDFGPYSMFGKDGYEYLFLASQVSGGQLDLFYERYLPRNGNNLPVISGPIAITRLNSSDDDAYLTFNSAMDSLYFCSNRAGNFDIYVQPDTVNTPLSTWLGQSFSTSYLVDSLNSSADDKCPFIHKNIMVFSSNRAGGLGGFDLYYSIFRNGKWSAPYNFGPGINTADDEYRPILLYDANYTNLLMIFSSNRAGGKGGFDLYYTGVAFPQ
ncbi:MAG TPA: hypothetical protein VMT63_14460 [Bacteroidales bacterium]|nr:hypothetical protein [Bacteroidales bacterium]